MAVTTRELARQARVSREYIARLCRQSRIKASKPGGRGWPIPDQEAQRWLRERHKGGNTG